MKILIMTAIIALPFLALGQETQQAAPQTKETQPTAPVKGKKKHVQAPSKAQAKPETGAAQEPSKPKAKPETSANARGQTKVQGGAQDVNRTETGARSSTSQKNTSQTTTVNKQEFRSRHNEVFSLGRHPKEFFVQRFGASHFRLIGGTYFVFVDSCWVAVDVEGFVYTERVICPGDPDFIVVD